jgi:hypothetical protein
MPGRQGSHSLRAAARQGVHAPPIADPESVRRIAFEEGCRIGRLPIGRTGRTSAGLQLRLVVEGEAQQAVAAA